MLQKIPHPNLNTGENLVCVINHCVAVDPETGILLKSSYGHSKSGRGSNYLIIIPEDARLFGETNWDKDIVIKFRAFSIEEAINIAIQKIDKWKE